MAQTQPIKKNRYCWVIFICCCFAGLCGVGLISNTYGVFLPSIAADLGFKASEVSLLMTIASWVTVAFYWLGAKAMVKFNARWVTTIAGFVIAICLFMYSRGTQLWHFYLTATVCGAMGAFAALNVVPLLITNWFIKYRNTVTSIAFMMTGIGGAIYNPLFANISVSSGWRTGYVTAACIALIYPILCLIFVRMTPAEKGLQPLGFADSEEMKSIKDQVQIKEFPGVPTKYAFRSLPFWFILIFTVTNSFASGYNQHWVNTGVTYGFDLVSASVFTTAALLGSSAFKVIAGIVNDKIGVIKSAFIFSLLGAIAMIIMIINHANPSYPIIMIACILFGGSICLTTLQPPMLCRETFGMRNYTSIYPIANMAMSIGTGLTYTLNAVFLEAAGSYMGSFIFNLICIAVSIVAVLVVGATTKSMKAKYWREVGQAI